MKTIVVIPARLASSRLANKLLLDLGGQSIIERVYRQCVLAKSITDVFIAVDDQILEDHCKQFTQNVLLTSKTHTSGTDRIAEAVQQIECDVVINVQGDEPFIDPDIIDELSAAFLNDQVKMCSAMSRFTSAEALTDTNNVKVVVDKNKNALYFSRSPIPYNRDGTLDLKKAAYFKHIGIYAYKKDFILTYAQLQKTPLEEIEKLEQLRVLEHGFNIKMIETQHKPLGIDTQEDYEFAKKIVIN